MADASSFIGRLEALFGMGSPSPQPDAGGSAPLGSVDDYLSKRGDARFARMADEVKGMLKGIPINSEVVDWSGLRRDLRQKGYDQKEEDAMINVLARQHGARQGVMEVQKDRPSYAEGQNIPGSLPQQEAKPEKDLPQTSDERRDNQVMDFLLDNQIKSGRDRYHGGSPQSWAGFDT